MRFTFFFMLLSFSVFAQHESQPQKESSSDLRTGIVMFSLEDVSEKATYWLERTVNLDYFLRKRKNEDETIRKVDTRDAKKLDQDFATRFLKIQYEMGPAKEDCEITLRLTMKGEGMNICKKEDRKTQELEPFLQGLIKRF